jgi:peptidoglycan/xylan/chitin deacetylase (PgdA/CDA1 family)
MIPNFELIKDYLDLAIINCKNPRHFALTFDDGPQIDLTNAILDLLKAKGVKATFFQLPSRFINNPQTVEVAKRVLSEGHLIGSHSYNHPNFLEEIFKNKDCDKLKFQMFEADRLFKEHLGISPKYFRPPFGELNRILAKNLQNWGYSIVLWNLDTNDWRWNGIEKLNIVKIYELQFKGENPPFKSIGSYISLQHDVLRNPEASIERLSHAINLIKDNGYKLVDISECIGKPKEKYFDKLEYDDKKCEF